MRCLVTGATGLIGSRLTQLALDRGAEVAALVRPVSDLWRISHILPRLRVIQGELANINEVGLQIKDFKPDVIFHLGWYGVGNRHRNDLDQIKYNLNGSLDLLQLGIATGCKRWVGVGSQAEYGPFDGILSEKSPLRPITTYGVIKLSVGLISRVICEAFHVEYVWLRLLAAYGPMDDPGHLIPQVTLNLLKGERPALSHGNQLWDYLYVDDVATALWKAGTEPGGKGTFVLGSGQAITVRRTVEIIRDLIDPSLELGFGEIQHRNDQPPDMHADITAFKAAVNWSAVIPLEEGLERTVTWFRENRSRYGV